MAYILEYLKHEYGRSIREGNFYDLGSGTGKPVVAMSLIYHFKKLIGIEFLESLFKLSLGVKQSYDRIINNRFQNYRQLFNFRSPNQIEFFQGDFLKYNWENTSIIFANSTCFSFNTMISIGNKANKECKSGTIIITITKRITNLNANWEIRDGFRRLMAWGIATIYIHRRK